MNILVTIILLLFGAAWLTSFALRDSAWGYPLWFPLTATAAIGTLVWLTSIISFCSMHPGGGDAEHWAAMGAGMAFLNFLVCPIILAVSVLARPRKATPPVIIFVIITSYGAICAGVAVSAKTIERIPVRLTVVDSQEVPVVGATVSYQTRPRGDNIGGSSLQGKTVTDAKGAATTFTQRTHETDITVQMPGFEDIKLRIDRCWGSFTNHQSSVSWNTHPPTRKWEIGHGASFDIPTGNQLAVKIYLPHTGQDKLPYPADNLTK